MDSQSYLILFLSHITHIMSNFKCSRVNHNRKQGIPEEKAAKYRENEMCETQNNKKTNVSKQHGIVLVMIKGWRYLSSDLRAKKIVYINISQSGWYIPPGGIASILGGSNTKMGSWGGGGNTDMGS